MRRPTGCVESAGRSGILGAGESGIATVITAVEPTRKVSASCARRSVREHRSPPVPMPNGGGRSCFDEVKGLDFTALAAGTRNKTHEFGAFHYQFAPKNG